MDQTIQDSIADGWVREADVREPSADKFLEAALSGGAKTIVCSDRDLLDLKEAEGIPIVSPREFAAD